MGRRDKIFSGLTYKDDFEAYKLPDKLLLCLTLSSESVFSYLAAYKSPRGGISRQGRLQV